MLRSKYQMLADSLSENIFKTRTQANPIMLVVLAYLLLIAIGTALLSLPQASTRPVSLIEAFFTSMSAVCVTGLSVVDISSLPRLYYNRQVFPLHTPILVTGSSSSSCSLAGSVS